MEVFFNINKCVILIRIDNNIYKAGKHEQYLIIVYLLHLSLVAAVNVMNSYKLFRNRIRNKSSELLFATKFRSKCHRNFATFPSFFQKGITFSKRRTI